MDLDGVESGRSTQVALSSSSPLSPFASFADLLHPKDRPAAIELIRRPPWKRQQQPQQQQQSMLVSFVDGQPLARDAPVA